MLDLMEFSGFSIRWLTVLGVLAVAACTPKVPDAVKTDLSSGPAGTTTLVAFTDYECPYCRTAHLELSKALQTLPKTNVRIVRHHVPLPSHPHAEQAARAAICVEALGGRTEIVDARLFEAPPGRLDAATCEEAAVDAGISNDAYRACIHSPATDDRLRRDLAAYMQTSAFGVPLVFVGTERIEGAQDAQAFRDAIERSASAKH